MTRDLDRDQSLHEDRASAIEEGGMAWKVEGQYFENCSCDVPCPCTVGGSAFASPFSWAA